MALGAFATQVIIKIPIEPSGAGKGSIVVE